MAIHKCIVGKQVSRALQCLGAWSPDSLGTLEDLPCTPLPSDWCEDTCRGMGGAHYVPPMRMSIRGHGGVHRVLALLGAWLNYGAGNRNVPCDLLLPGANILLDRRDSAVRIPFRVPSAHMHCGRWKCPLFTSVRLLCRYIVGDGGFPCSSDSGCLEQMHCGR